MSWGTISWQELLWTILVLIALGFNIKGAMVAWADRTALRVTGKNGVREIIATIAIENELVRAAMHLVFVAIGLAAMRLPPNQEDPQGHSQIVFVVLFVGVAAMNTFFSVKRLTVRKKIERMIEEEINGPAR
jgi:hypothetical protein